MASLVIASAGPGATDAGPAEPDFWRSTVAAVRAWFDQVEEALSPYRADSDLVRWRTGAARLEDCSPLLAEVVSAVEPLPEATGGGFHPYDRSGRFDPTGYVKGWAVERGVDILADRGVGAACMGIGGDLQTIGRAAVDRPWRLAVTDPTDDLRPAALVVAADDRFALATSGEVQRGAHIWSALGGTAAPPAGKPTALASISVAGPHLSLADSYATAVWSLARTKPLDEAWQWLDSSGYEALAVLPDGRLRTTPGMRTQLVGTEA